MACIGCIKCAACFRPLHTVYKPSIYLKVPIGYHGYVPEGLSCSFHDSFGGNVIPSLAAYVAVCSTGPCSFYSYPTVQVHTDRNIYHLSYIIYHISYMHRILELQFFRPGRYRSNSRRIFQKICWASTHSQHSPCLPLMIFRYIRLPLRPLLRHTSDSYIHDLLLCVTLWEP